MPRAPLSALAVLPALAALALAAAQSAAAQVPTTRPLAVGSRARVTASALGPDRRVATVLAHRGDTLALRPEGTQDSLALPLAQVTRLEVSRGERGRVRRGLALGLLGGAVLGAAGGYAMYESDPCAGESIESLGCLASPPLSRSEEMLVGAGLGGLLGAVAGGVAGALWRTERWERVPLGPRVARVRVRPDYRRGLTLAVAF